MQVLDHVYEMFHIRYTLHRKAYQHKVHKAIDLMISDAMGKANFVFKVDGNRKEVTLSIAVDDLDAFCKLTDQFVVDKISEFSEEARELVNRIYTRKLYKFVGEKRIELQELKDGETVKQKEKTIQPEEQLTDELVGDKEGIKEYTKVQLQELKDGETVKQKEKTTQTEEQLTDELVGDKEGIKKHIKVQLQELKDGETVKQKEKTTQTEEQLTDELVGAKEGIKEYTKVQLQELNDEETVTQQEKTEEELRNELVGAKEGIKEYIKVQLEDVQSDCLMMKPKYIRVRIARVFCTEEAHVGEVKALVNAWNP